LQDLSQYIIHKLLITNGVGYRKWYPLAWELLTGIQPIGKASRAIHNWPLLARRCALRSFDFESDNGMG
jgi:hypothetical protein